MLYFSFLCLVNLVVILCHIYSTVLVNEWYNTFYLSLSGDLSSIFYLIGLFVIYSFVRDMSISLQKYFQSNIALIWRDKIIRKAIKRVHPSFITVENADQRLCEDSHEFTSSIIEIIFECILHVLSLLMFVKVLFQLTSVTKGMILFLSMLCYTGISTIITSSFMQKFLLKVAQQDETNEANARSYAYELHKCVHGFCEVLKLKLRDSLQILVANKKTYYLYNMYGTAIRKLFDENLGMIFPYIILLVFTKSTFSNMGTIMQLVNCLVMIKFRLMFFMHDEVFKSIYYAKVSYKRLKEYLDNITDNHSKMIRSDGENFAVYFSEIKIKDKKLFENFKLQLQSGESMCLYGRSGIGKTTLLNHMNDCVQNATGTMQYNGKLRCICLKNILYYIEKIHGGDLSYLSQGELQDYCIKALLKDKPDWIVWDEFCLGLSIEAKKDAFYCLKSNLINTGLIILTQDKLEFCDQYINLEESEFLYCEENRKK